MNSYVDIIVNAIGMIGVAMMVVAFFLMQNGTIDNKSMIYQLLNLIGAILVAISLLRFWNLSSFVIEMFWIAISLLGIYRLKKNNN